MPVLYFLLDKGKGQRGTSVVQPGTARTRKKVSWDPSVGKPSRHVTSYSQLVKKWLFQHLTKRTSRTKSFAHF
eukprot:scaffold3640_cov201-Alexandrium_tamarense.AAC.8